MSQKYVQDCKEFWQDILDLLSDIQRFVPYASKIDDILCTHVFMNLAYNKHPTRDNINALIKDIGKL